MFERRTLSETEDSIGPGAADGLDICVSVATENRRRKGSREIEQILTDIYNREPANHRNGPKPPQYAIHTGGTVLLCNPQGACGVLSPRG